ncbi:hypothetical protein BN8_04305 [Fibrisoma limi BUZ 3]|uniref:Uncharacterized protein n=1 Tax=Fibrisoma limi BUZ 3 TaxID=1185876 RepID=I2GME3_9BACT|nr:hypothetical protein BN8_04305 [Fibrisoma limi BUZ 3]
MAGYNKRDNKGLSAIHNSRPSEVNPVQEDRQEA